MVLTLGRSRTHLQQAIKNPSPGKLYFHIIKHPTKFHNLTLQKKYLIVLKISKTAFVTYVQNSIFPTFLFLKNLRKFKEHLSCLRKCHFKFHIHCIILAILMAKNNFCMQRVTQNSTSVSCNHPYGKIDVAFLH